MIDGTAGKQGIPDKPEGSGGPEVPMQPGPDVGKTDGKYPDGKMSVDDEGEVKIAIGFTEGRVIINFGSPVTWIGLNPAKAREMARHLLMTADAIELDKSIQRLKGAPQPDPQRPGQ